MKDDKIIIDHRVMSGNVSRSLGQSVRVRVLFCSVWDSLTRFRGMFFGVI
jgi:hypothetical protein